MSKQAVKLGKALTDLLTGTSSTTSTQKMGTKKKATKKAGPSVQLASPEEAVKAEQVKKLIEDGDVDTAWAQYEDLFSSSNPKEGTTRPWLHDLGNEVQRAILEKELGLGQKVKKPAGRKEDY
jgi:hypothetical protein